jgi:serine/threonine protein kinase
VMELLEGETLGAKLARDERLCVEETASLLLPVASAVSAAHALGIVHRDLKPENIFLAHGADGPCVKVLDFGIAKLTAEHCLEQASPLVTDVGVLLGTPCYMAPEQIRGIAVDHRADIWSLGVILYECLSGTRPIEGESPADVVARLITDGITPLERITPELPAEITGFVQCMLTRDPERRPKDLTQLCALLERHARVITRIGPLRTSAAGTLPEPPTTSAKHPLRPLQTSTLPSATTLVAEAPAPPSKTRRRPLIPIALGTAAASALVFTLFRAPNPAAPPSPAAAAAFISRAPINKAVRQMLAASEQSARPAASKSDATAARVSAQNFVQRARHGTPFSSAHPAAAGPGRAPLDEDALFSGRK